MKKSELRNIIRESVKEVLKEQSTPNSHKIIRGTVCHSDIPQTASSFSSYGAPGITVNLGSSGMGNGLVKANGQMFTQLDIGKIFKWHPFGIYTTHFRLQTLELPKVCYPHQSSAGGCGPIEDGNCPQLPADEPIGVGHGTELPDPPDPSGCPDPQASNYISTGYDCNGGYNPNFMGCGSVLTNCSCCTYTAGVGHTTGTSTSQSNKCKHCCLPHLPGAPSTNAYSPIPPDCKCRPGEIKINCKTFLPIP